MTKNKIEELKEKIQKDLEKIKELESIRNNEIAKLITRINLNNIEDEILVGSLLYIKDQFSTNYKLKEEWLEAGRKFLKRKSRISSPKELETVI